MGLIIRGVFGQDAAALAAQAEKILRRAMAGLKKRKKKKTAEVRPRASDV